MYSWADKKERNSRAKNEVDARMQRNKQVYRYSAGFYPGGVCQMQVTLSFSLICIRSYSGQES